MISFLSFLNEDSSSYDLYSKYNEFNKLYFNGELPNIKLKWTKSSKLAGQVRVRFMVRKVMGKKVIESYEILDLALSKFYERTEEDYDSILLHEMIHVYLDVNGVHEGYDGVEHHGKEFMAKLKEIERKSKITIAVTDNLPNRKLAKDSIKEVGVVLVNVNGNYSIAVFTKNTFLKNQHRLTSDRWTFSGDSVIFRKGIVTNELIPDYPAKRTANKVGFYVLSVKKGDALAKELDAKDKALYLSKVKDVLNTKIVGA